MEKICTKCGALKSIKDFYFRKIRNNYSTICRDCIATRVRVKRNGTSENSGFIMRKSLHAWEQPDIIYISKDLNKYVPKKLIVKRCEYCKSEIYKKNSFKNNFCSEWCFEMI